MIAGTLAVFDDPADEPLEPFIRAAGYPALTVDTTQSTVDDATPQTGTVAGRIGETRTNVYTGTDSDGTPYVETDRDDTITAIATDWCADVTGSGVVLSESIAANEEVPFPFDVFGGLLESNIERKQIDVESLHRDWDGDGGLSKVWMAGNDERGASMAYHGSAADVEPTIGLGFKRAWNGTTIKGVCWASGYVALYNARHAADGLQFVADEILPYTEAWDPETHEDQTDFDEFGSDSGGRDVVDEVEHNLGGGAD